MSYSPIAITGIGCRYPGGIKTAANFWQFINAKKHSVEPIPQARKDLWATWGYDETTVAFGGWIDQVEYFDAAFFQISPREARQIDPQQRLLLEIAYEAIEDAGIPPFALAGKSVGVFTGLFLDEYWDLQRYVENNLIDSNTNTGGTMSLAANRISYAFDLKGPSMSVDTACSSSLTAIHLACRSLHEQECEMAIAGGVNLILAPHTTRGFEKAGMLSPDGFCRAFDAGANGYGRSDGAGLVILKPLDKAIEVGDSIYAVIQGSAVNQDGKTRGLTQPDPTAQTNVIQAAARSAGINPSQLTYIEAHGTGTPVGDPLEAAAISDAVGRTSPCMIGSIKTNIGHTEAASGVAGLIKAALILKNGLIPPSLHFNKPNPDIPFDELNLKVVTDPVQIGDEAIAGVNSFGFGGANAHVILSKAPIIERPAHPSTPYFLPLSAATQDALNERISDVYAYIKSNDKTDLYALAATSGEKCNHHKFRMSLAVKDYPTLSATLQAYINGEYPDDIVQGSPREIAPLAFIFTGMGPQWWGMGSNLYQTEPAYREAIDHCDGLYHEYSRLSIREEMMNSEADSRMGEPEVSQPANLMLQWALSRLWASWGITPDVVIGHSVGEIAAAAVAGALTLEEALHIIYHRSRLQQQYIGKGAMIAAGLSSDEAMDLIKQHPETLSIAAYNSPVSVTFSGDVQTIERLEQLLQAREVYCKRLQVNIAYHSHQMDLHRTEFTDAVKNLYPRPTSIPMISTVEGKPVDGTAMSADYWWRNIREPIQFEEACSHLPDGQNILLIQIGPHPVLTPSILENMAHAGRSGFSLASLKRNVSELETLQHTLAHCYAQGHALSWSNIYQTSFEPEKLPGYPWQKEKYWPELNPYRNKTAGKKEGMFLSTGLTSAIDPKMKIWEAEIDLEGYSFLRDHRMHNKIIFPMAGLIAMLMETGSKENRSFQHVEIQNPLILSEDQNYPIQITETSSAFTISRLLNAVDNEESDWETIAVARHPVMNQKGSGPPSRTDLALQQAIPGVEFYELIQNRGYEYGTHFRWIQHIQIYDEAVHAHIVLPVNQTSGIHLHPVLIDNAIQAMIPLIPESGFFLPVSVDRVWHHKSGASESEFDVKTSISTQSDHAITGDIHLFNSRGELLLELLGITFKEAGTQNIQPSDHGLSDSLWSERWVPVSIPADISFPEDDKWLIITQDGKTGKYLQSRLKQHYDFVEIILHAEDKNKSSLPPLRQYVDVESGREHAMVINILVLTALDSDPNNNPPDTEQAGYILRLLQSVLEDDTPNIRLWLITSGSQNINSSDIPNLSQAGMTGLGRSLAAEHPELRVTLIDISSVPDLEEINTLAALLNHSGYSMEYGIRDLQIYTRRLEPVHLSQYEPSNLSSAGFDTSNYRLTTTTPGAIENIQFYNNPMPSLSDDEILLRVLATGMNFRDVMTSLGILPGINTDVDPLLGWECVGEVISVGAAVGRFNNGDQVVAIVPGCAGKFVTIKEELAASKPKNLSILEAVSLPIAFATAYHALVKLGGLERGKRVLIHSATGGVGLAAVQLAKMYGAEIFATAGSEEKRGYLKKLGILHISDSRSTDFADEILQATDHEGVDIVLNSLSGDGMRAGLSVLAPYGHFIEIGKTDILSHQSLDLNMLEQNISYHVVDLASMSLDCLDKLGALLGEIVNMASTGHIVPLPVKSKPIQQAQHLFRTMAQARHIGKLVLEGNDHPVNLRLRSDDKIIKQEATYIITGGMGGIGQVITRWLLENGAGAIVLLGRRDVDLDDLPSHEKESDAVVRYIQVDVSDASALSATLDKIESTGPPVRGVFHCAGVLDDGLLMNYDETRLKAVMASKAVGAWHLHQLTQKMPLDYFVLFSSVASVVGTAGQGGYAAANACLDALAVMRRRGNLPALSVNWGPWENTGMTDDPHVADRMQRLGFKLIPQREASRLLDRFLHHDLHQICVMPFESDDPRIKRGNPLFADIIEPGNSSGRSSMDAGDISDLRKMSTAQQERLVSRNVFEAVGRIIEMDTARIDRNQSWRSLGIDSLMAVEIRHQIEKMMKVSIPATELQSTKSITETIDDILSQLQKASK